MITRILWCGFNPFGRWSAENLAGKSVIFTIKGSTRAGASGHISKTNSLQLVLSPVVLCGAQPSHPLRGLNALCLTKNISPYSQFLRLAHSINPWTGTMLT